MDFSNIGTFITIALNLMVFIGVNQFSDYLSKRNYITYRSLWIGTGFWLLGVFLAYTVKLW